MTKQRRTFTTEFKCEVASLVLDQGYSHIEAAQSISLVESASNRWGSQLQKERGGVALSSKKLLELEARINRLKREQPILKSYRALDGKPYEA